MGYSSLLALHTPWLSSNNSELSKRARTVVGQILEKTSTNLVVDQCLLERNPEEMAPWGLFFIYRISVVLLLLKDEIPNSLEIMRAFRGTFLALSIRWKVAGMSYRF